MTDHYVRLSCLNCSRELDVYDDMERCFCAHCGAAIAIERRGGTIALRPADKINSETHLPDLARQRDEMLTQLAVRKKQGFLLGGALLVLGFLIVRLGIGYLSGLGMLIAGIVLIVFVRRHNKSVQVDVRILQAKIDALNGRTG